MSLPLDELTVTSAAAAIQDGALTATELMGMVLDRARATEPLVHAYVHLDKQQAMDAARSADEHQRRGLACGPLHGIPIGVKDLIATADMPTEAGSAVLHGHRPRADAEAVRRLRGAGAVIIGKHHTHEFGFGMDDPPTRSLWDLDRYAGGSTVGGGVSVAVGSCLAALGTDGGGSIRKPAAITGTVGLKPTFGAVSTEGVLPGATSVDHIGWLTRTVADAGLLLEVLAETGTIPTPDHGVSGVRIGCPDYLFRDLDADIAATVEAALTALTEAGAQMVRVDIPELEHTPLIHGTLGGSELYQLHERWVQQVPHQYHQGSLRFLRKATGSSAEDRAMARRHRAQLHHAMEDVFTNQGVDALCSPTIPLAPVVMAEMDPDRLLPEYTRLTAPFNVTGQPALSVPCGLSASGLPIGLQIVGQAHDEVMVLRVGKAVEETGVWARGREAGLNRVRQATGN